MIVKHLTVQQSLDFGDKEEAKIGFYWQAEVDDSWIGPFENFGRGVHRRQAMLLWRGLSSLPQ